MCPIKRVFFGIVILICISFPVLAEENGWIIAAEKFTVQDMPPTYENFSSIIPQLILANISGISSRKVFKNELQARELQTLSDSRIKLIRDRAELVTARDKIFLTSDPLLVKQRKKNETNARIQAKEKEIDAVKEKIQEVMSGTISGKPTVAPLKTWKNSSGLFARPENSSLVSSLQKEKISGLITGTVQDIAGYMYVTAQLETGIEGLPAITVSDAASYDDIENLVETLTTRLLPEISKRRPIDITIEVIPETARVFVDGRLIQDYTQAVTVFSGEHTISVSASGYVPANKTALFDIDRYRVKITLEKESMVTVAFDTQKMNSGLFLHTQYFGDSPQTVSIPAIQTIGEVVTDGITTWFIFNPDKLDTATDIRMTVKPNKMATEKRIERQRSMLYWSIGALYLSLPVSFLTYGISSDKNQAYLDGRLEDTAGVRSDLNAWSRASTVSRGISLGLGINLVVQIVRYLIAADQATPQYAEQITE